MWGLEPGGTIIFTVKSSPAISSTKYLNGGMLTVMILVPLFEEFRLQDNRAKIARIVNILFIRL
jgi:hypothetical protein